MQTAETGDEKTETRGTFTVRGDSRGSTDDRASVIHSHCLPGGNLHHRGQGGDDGIDTVEGIALVFFNTYCQFSEPDIQIFSPE